MHFPPTPAWTGEVRFLVGSLEIGAPHRRTLDPQGSDTIHHLKPIVVILDNY